jgi:Tol biopolymer transport system component
LLFAPVLLGRCTGDVGRPANGTASVSIAVHEGTSLAFDLSRDGSNIAFDLLGQIWILSATGGEARALTDAVRDTAEEERPSFSPDGRSIAFAGERAGHAGIWLVDVASGAVRRLTTPPQWDDQPAWSPDGSRIAFIREVSRIEGARVIGFDGLHVLDQNTGAVSLVAVGDSGTTSVHDPAWSTDGATIYVTAPQVLPGGRPGTAIWAVDVATGRRTVVSDSKLMASAAAPAPDGRRLLYFAPDSASRQQLWLHDTGGRTPRQLTNEAAITPRSARWTPDGSAVLYVAAGRVRRLDLATATATEIPFTANLAFIRTTPSLPQRQFPAPGSQQPARGQLGLALAPDAQVFAMLALGQLWIVPIGGDPRAVARVPADARDVEWAPSQDRVAYSVGAWGEEDIQIVDLTTGRTRAVTALAGQELVPRWSPDGRWIAFVHAAPDSADHLLVVGADAAAVARRSDSRDLGPAYTNDWAVGLGGATAPVWRPDSRALLVFRQLSTPVIREPFEILRPTQAEIVPLDGPRRKLARSPIQPIYVSWTDDTTLVYLRGDRPWRARFSDEAGVVGEAVALNDDPALYLSAARDGSVLYVSTDGLRVRDSAGRVRRLGWPITYEVPVPPPLLVHNARVLDGTGSPPTEPRDLLVRGGRIEQIAANGSLQAPGAQVLDAAGGVVMPGLADLHFHYDGPEQLRGLVYNGVTVVRDQGSDIGTLAARAEGGAAGEWPAPRISFGAFQVYSDWAFSNGLEQGLEPEQDAGHLERVVALLVAHGADHMKIRTFHGWPVNARLVEAAHRAGLRTTGHCVLPLALLAAGMDTKEHLGDNCGARLDAPLREDVLQVFRASGVAVVPTTIVYSWSNSLRDRGILERPEFASFLVPIKKDPLRGLAEGDPDEWVNEQSALMIEQARALHRAGVPLGVGTDAPVLPWGVHLELERLVEAGLTPLEAIRAGTETSAQILGHDAELGTVTAGKLADLIVLEPGADPSLDIRATRRIRHVILRGAVVDRASLLQSRTVTAHR